MSAASSRRWWRWQAGRQQSGYDKMLLATAHWPIPFDLYLLRFNEGSAIPMHVDAVDNGAHYRLNCVLKAAQRGGDFVCDQVIYASSRIKLFRPDIARHAVTRVESGRRYVLSLGWIKNQARSQEE